ncbi:TIGR04283 family arsenosugar biosynthesis glycosyltransferase [Prochlorococcus marinus]|uniref:4,4'-diaponeurosporenoate glycosyltransferase n=1 Tax=Prochlorococcus marinus (strain AS9601) TaxID=146891 RepID=A2BQ44_PROMS|nr:TIGR04283 family arsenosugar biosynthesis glycosyltransferase [Prochlorococcus marinus]ABM69905.1 Glycosyltransferases involved in cell wall biogenesis [Prochlorococcus marinus str. AS9601]
MSKISIIIPTINEASNLPLLLSDLSSIQEEGEIIIVDSGSEDKTIDIANIYGAKVFISKERNRGLQLDIGAKNSKGEWLIFLHADTRLTHDWFKKINSFLKGNKNIIYYFEFKINHKNIIYRVLEILVNIRSKFFKQPYGDQGLIIHRTIYFKNNGFRNIPLMEDVDFLMRLNKKKDLKQLNFPIFISSRKWERTNIFLQAIKNWHFRRRWLKGESLKSIYSDYYKK